MKRTIALLLFTCIVGNGFSQEIQQRNVPAVVLNAFQLKFSNATDADWKLENGNYNVGFEVNNKDNEVVINDKGNILKHKQDLYFSEIPKTVIETIRSKVALFDLNDAERSEEAGKISYTVNFEISGKDHDFWIDEKGKLLKFTKELKESELTPAISTMINNKYGPLDIDRALLTEENGNIVYNLKGSINDMDHTFVVDVNANIKKHEQDLKNSEIPPQVMSAVKASYNGYEIRDADLTEEGGTVFYSLDMRRSNERIKITMSPDGKIISGKK